MLDARISSDDGWFTNEDHNFRFTIYQSDNETVQDITGWSLSWLVKKRLSHTDAQAVITKTTSGGISLTSPTLGICTVEVLDTDTLDVPAGVYIHELKRTDPGQEAVLAQGTAVLRKSAHAS